MMVDRLRTVSRRVIQAGWYHDLSGDPCRDGRRGKPAGVVAVDSDDDTTRGMSGVTGATPSQPRAPLGCGRSAAARAAFRKVRIHRRQSSLCPRTARGTRVTLIDGDSRCEPPHHPRSGRATGRRSPTSSITRHERLDDIWRDQYWLGWIVIAGSRRAGSTRPTPSTPRKARLLRHIAALPADHVVIDLGAGSSFNVLDFFLAAEHAVVVWFRRRPPWRTPISSWKAAYFRKMRRAQPRGPRQGGHRCGPDGPSLEALGIRSPRELLLRSPRPIRSPPRGCSARQGASTGARRQPRQGSGAPQLGSIWRSRVLRTTSAGG